MAEQKKFYWLKLKKDFFKRHDIQIIESMPNGKDYVLFYLKLMCESIDHEGNLRFSDTIPYNEQMLSTITNTNIDVVRSALKLLQELNMIEILDDHTIYMNEVDKLIGSAVDNDNANRQRRFRERQKTLALSECYESVTKDNESKSIDIEKDKENREEDIDIDSKKKSKRKSEDYEAEFEEIWLLYPRKELKSLGLKHYISARKNGVTYEEIKDGVERYVAHCKIKETDKDYITKGGNFFYKKLWSDDFDMTPKTTIKAYGANKAVEKPESEMSEADRIMWAEIERVNKEFKNG